MSPELAEHGKKLIEERHLGFDILSDPGLAVAAAFGLRFVLPEDLRKLYLGFGIDLAACNGEPSWALPMPARFVIDREGTVRDARVSADYKIRPEPADTLAALAAL